MNRKVVEISETNQPRVHIPLHEKERDGFFLLSIMHIKGGIKQRQDKGGTTGK